MIDLSKKWKTRLGHEVELFAKKDNVIYGILKVNNKWVSDNWFNDGSYHDSPFFEHELDLIEVKEKKTVTSWVNIYKNGIVSFQNENEAIICAGTGIIARKQITIEYEEGEGL
jgi:hypothetical protein